MYPTYDEQLRAKLREVGVTEQELVGDSRDEGLVFDGGGHPVGYQAYVTLDVFTEERVNEIIELLVKSGFQSVDGEVVKDENGTPVYSQINYWYKPDDITVEDFKRVYDATPPGQFPEYILEFFEMSESMYEDLYEMAFVPAGVMTVGELIDRLKGLDPDSLVLLVDPDFSVNGEDVEEDDCHQNVGKINPFWTPTDVETDVNIAQYDGCRTVTQTVGAIIRMTEF